VSVSLCFRHPPPAAAAPPPVERVRVRVRARARARDSRFRRFDERRGPRRPRSPAVARNVLLRV